MQATTSELRKMPSFTGFDCPVEKDYVLSSAAGESEKVKEPSR